MPASTSTVAERATEVAFALHSDWACESTWSLCGKPLGCEIRRRLNPADPDGVNDATVSEVEDDFVAWVANSIAEQQDYELDSIEGMPSRIGCGGFAYVFKGRDRKNSDLEIALKVLKPTLRAAPSNSTASSPEARFQNEIYILQRLSHDGLPKCYRGGEVKTMMYYIMEYVSGESLDAASDLIKQLGTSKVIEFEIEVLRVLDYIHTKGFAHRDVTPKNILVTNSAKNSQKFAPKIIDFGTAKNMEADASSDTRTGQETRAPERYEDPFRAHYQSKRDERPCDIYSVGMIFEDLMLASTGPPSPNSTPWDQTVARNDAARPPALMPVQSPDLISRSHDALANRLREIRNKCACGPEQRYGTIREVLRDMEDLLRLPQGTAAGPLSPMTAQQSDQETSLPAHLAAGSAAVGPNQSGALLHSPQTLPVDSALHPVRPPAGAPKKSRLPRGIIWAGTVLFLVLAVLAVVTKLRRDLEQERREHEVTSVKLKVKDANLARLADANPEDVKENYSAALSAGTTAHRKWPEDTDLVGLLAKTHHEFAEYLRGAGDPDNARTHYTNSIELWEALRIRDPEETEVLVGLGKAYGCRGDVNLLKQNLESATNDYSESLKLREELANQDDTNFLAKIQVGRANSNFARLYRYSYDDQDMSKAKWKEVIRLFDGVRKECTAKDLKLIATRDLASSLLDHCSGYFAVIAEGKGEDVGDWLEVAKAVVGELADAYDPDARVQKYSYDYFAKRLSGTPQSYKVLAEEIGNLVSILPQSRQNWAKSLYVEVALSSWSEETKKDFPRALSYLQDLPANDYFFKQQRERCARMGMRR